MALYQAGAAVRHIISKFDAVVPAAAIPPPVIQLTVRRSHHDFEITGSVIITLYKAGNTRGIDGTEYATIVPRPSWLLIPPMMKPPARGQMHRFKIAVESS